MKRCARLAAIIFSLLLLVSGTVFAGEIAGGAGWDANELLWINEENFPDPVFRQWIQCNLDLDDDGNFTRTEAEAVKYINVNQSAGSKENGLIKSLQGVEYFSQLMEISCENNQLNELELTECHNLLKVDADGNPLLCVNLPDSFGGVLSAEYEEPIILNLGSRTSGSLNMKEFAPHFGEMRLKYTLGATITNGTKGTAIDGFAGNDFIYSYDCGNSVELIRRISVVSDTGYYGIYVFHKKVSGTVLSTSIIGSTMDKVGANILRGGYDISILDLTSENGTAVTAVLETNPMFFQKIRNAGLQKVIVETDAETYILSRKQMQMLSHFGGTFAELTLNFRKGKIHVSCDGLSGTLEDVSIHLDPECGGTEWIDLIAEKEAEEAAALAKQKFITGVRNTEITLKSTVGKGYIKLTWKKSPGYKVDYYEVYRSVKKNSGYGQKAFYRTSSGNKLSYKNTKGLKKGTRYYFKVRGVRIVDGKRIGTQWSNKAWRVAK